MDRKYSNFEDNGRLGRPGKMENKKPAISSGFPYCIGHLWIVKWYRRPDSNRHSLATGRF
jgi:hypothetical protein